LCARRRAQDAGRILFPGGPDRGGGPSGFGEYQVRQSAKLGTASLRRHTTIATMSITVSRARFRARALEYFDKVEKTGESVTVTVRGRPTIEIRRHPAAHVGIEKPLAALRGSVVRFDDPTAPAVGGSEWEALG